MLFGLESQWHLRFAPLPPATPPPAIPPTQTALSWPSHVPPLARHPARPAEPPLAGPLAGPRLRSRHQPLAQARLQVRGVGHGAEWCRAGQRGAGSGRAQGQAQRPWLGERRGDGCDLPLQPPANYPHSCQQPPGTTRNCPQPPTTARNRHRPDVTARRKFRRDFYDTVIAWAQSGGGPQYQIDGIYTWWV